MGSGIGIRQGRSRTVCLFELLSRAEAKKKLAKMLFGGNVAGAAGGAAESCLMSRTPSRVLFGGGGSRCPPASYRQRGWEKWDDEAATWIAWLLAINVCNARIHIARWRSRSARRAHRPGCHGVWLAVSL